MQKTAYEMRISDWSSDVCSSDLRVVGITGERVAWPAASFTLPRFMSDFTQVTVPVHSQSLLAITPYVVGGYDNIGRRSDFDAGADVVWKPNGQTQQIGRAHV